MVREDVRVSHEISDKSALTIVQITTDEFIDVLIGTRKYIPCLCSSSSRLLCDSTFYMLFLDVYNKVDSISLETVDRLAHEDHTLVISCEMGLK
jgi:uncharacterized protein